MMEAAERWNRAVIDEVPDEPLPHVNDTEAFKSQLVMGPAVAAISGWWQREQAYASPGGSTAPAA
jgi:hypothetical protein